MEERKTITDKMLFRVGKNVKFETYRVDLSWKDIIETVGILPTDEFGGVKFFDEKVPSFSYDTESSDETYSIAYVIVYRKRLETDDEFLKRMESEERSRKLREESEKLEYLRLKAKFEPKL